VHSVTNYSHITPTSELAINDSPTSELVIDDSPTSELVIDDSPTSEFVIDDSRESMNRILAQLDLSPIKFQTRKKLDKCSDSNLRRMTSKLTNTVKVFAGMF
jgi:hypothetical protein